MKTIIHVNQAVIRRNRKLGTNEPPIIVRTYKGTRRAHNVKVQGDVEIINRPDKPLSCGARVWIETKGKVVTK